MPRIRPRIIRAAMVTAVAAVAASVASPVGASPGPSAPSTTRPMAASRPAHGLPFGLSAVGFHRMLAQVPLDEAAAKIRHAAAGTPAGRRGFVQIRVDAGRSSLTVYWHGRVPASMRHLFSALGRHLRLLVRPARYSLAELNHAISLASRANPRRVASAGPLTDGSGIQVGVTGRLPAVSPGAAERLFHTTVPVTVVAAPPARLYTCQDNPSDTLGPGSRCYDLAPGFWGGAVISIFGNGYILTYCSTGFGVHYSNGSTGMLTAGHCIHSDEVPSGSTWWNGQATTELGSTGHTPFLASSTASHDSGVIVTPAGSGDRYYDGPSIYAGDTYNTKVVTGQLPSNPGDWMCESGAIGGVLCNIKVLSTGDTTWLGGYHISGLVSATDPSSSAPVPGDSGGPVFSLAGTGAVTARGTITGGVSGIVIYYTPMDVISKDLGVTVNTG